MAVPQIDYYDPTLKKVQQGYVIGEKTYMDEAGTQRIPVGSLVATQGGTYMLGASGSTRINDSTTLPAEYYGTVQPTGAGAGAAQQAAQQTPTILSATDQSSYINDIYDARKSQQLSALDSAYKQSGNSLDLAKSQIPQQYQAERNQTAATSEIQRRNFNQYAAAQGLNTGANAQANLAFATKQQGALGNINMQEGNALANIETQRANLAIQYQAAVAEAISQNDYQRASALLEEARRVDDSYIAAQNAQTQLNLEAEERNRAQLEQRAATLAEFGDFSGYAALGYSQDQISRMGSLWATLNPELTSMLGGTGAATNLTASTASSLTTKPTTNLDFDGINTTRDPYGENVIPYNELPAYSPAIQEAIMANAVGQSPTMSTLYPTIQAATIRMQRSGYSNESIAAYIVQRLDNRDLTEAEALYIAQQLGLFKTSTTKGASNV